MLYGQRDPDVQIGMTLDESKRLAGKPDYQRGGFETGGIMLDCRCTWMHGLKETTVEFVISNIREREYRAISVEHDSVPLATFARKKCVSLRQKLGI